MPNSEREKQRILSAYQENDRLRAELQEVKETLARDRDAADALGAEWWEAKKTILSLREQLVKHHEVGYSLGWGEQCPICTQAKETE